jgi:hypothetical protein
MTERTKILLMGATLMAMLLPAAAQNSTAPSQPPVPSQTTVPTQTTTPAQSAPMTVQQRKQNQQGRIANGVADGQLNAGQASKLEKDESELNHEEKDMKAMDNGHLTSADRTTLNRQQNQLSNQIYNQKHEAPVQNQDPKSKVGQRAENQQDRIANGMKSGTLSAAQSSNLEKQETNLNQEVKADRQANGGKLTQQEKNQVNHQQNHLSNQIYKDKHAAKNNKK